MSPSIKVGCEVFVVRENKILLGRRLNCYGAGSWGLPGGHLEFLERTDVAASRELSEELGLSIDVSRLRLVSITDDPQREASVHYIHVSFEVILLDDEQVRLMEPDKCSEWKFVSTEDAVNENIFGPHVPILKNYTSGRLYSSSPE